MSDLYKEIERWGKGIGNANRCRILKVLMRRPLTVGEIVAAVRLTQPSVSQGLKILKAANLVTSRRSGQSMLYSINVVYVSDVLNQFMRKIQKGRKKLISVKRAYARGQGAKPVRGTV